MRIKTTVWHHTPDSVTDGKGTKLGDSALAAAVVSR